MDIIKVYKIIKTDCDGAITPSGDRYNELSDNAKYLEKLGVLDIICLIKGYKPISTISIYHNNVISTEYGKDNKIYYYTPFDKQIVKKAYQLLEKKHFYYIQTNNTSIRIFRESNEKMAFLNVYIYQYQDIISPELRLIINGIVYGYSLKNIAQAFRDITENKDTYNDHEFDEYYKKEFIPVYNIAVNEKNKILKSKRFKKFIHFIKNKSNDTFPIYGKYKFNKTPEGAQLMLVDH